jgi:hypothetical protein
MTPSLKRELPKAPQLSALRNVDPEKDPNHFTSPDSRTTSGLEGSF